MPAWRRDWTPARRSRSWIRRQQKWDTVRGEQASRAHRVNLEGVRAIVRSGATVVITGTLADGKKSANLVTGEDGGYRFEGLPPGKFTVAAWPGTRLWGLGASS